MITFSRVPHAEMRAAHNRVAHLMADRPAPPPANVGTVLQLSEPEPLIWDGAELALRPLPYHDGLRMIELKGRIEALAPKLGEDADARAAFGRALDECVDLFYAQLLDPPPLNPFADSTVEEVGQLLGFFWKRQMTSPGLSPSRMGRPGRGMC